ncbi:tyrosine recombinase XerC [Notoacmeibacter sp. MSK16QG-6]|uniref:site-specific integrase n=1 Tax=Notoacmeibacter sp. MSK16QG-6 TaxID=2957982 RepID=UPI00209D8E23|nr:tyrosine-type recombinase/integrase [Notoacmeibacter sp. MSK16QG-6]MCP1200098.1 tyrosine-type recombinase/integrase [Notoacmeibacter sp. MSK16QG-6]
MGAMATHPDYPYCSSFRDRHGRERWRFRRKGKTIALPGAPGEDAFDQAFYAALNGHDTRRARPRARTMEQAWAIVTEGAAWRAMRSISRTNEERIAGRFLAEKVGQHGDLVWRDVELHHLRRSDIRRILVGRPPHAAWRLLIVLRKMIRAAIDEEWISADITIGVMKKPRTAGWKAWPPEMMAAYLRRWPVGTTPHLTFCLALWLGNRRADIVTLKWSQRKIEARGGAIRRGWAIVQQKGEKAIWVPETAMLSAALEATGRQGPHVLLTQYGKPFSEKSLTGRMADWTKAAGLPRGYTLHGLRKTLGRLAAEGGATTRQSMDLLGHDAIEHAELYSREADQIILAEEAMAAAERRWRDLANPNG